MQLATIRSAGRTVAVRREGEVALEIGALDVGELLSDDQWRARAEAADGPAHPLPDLEFAPLVPRPEKVLCVGLNYRSHIAEMGHGFPDYPTLFAKYPPALIGAGDDIVLPPESTSMDWEAELALVIGAPLRRATAEQAVAGIAGYSVFNDVSARDWQWRTSQFLQGKTFEGTSPLGPWLVTTDEPAVAAGHFPLSCEVSGALMQQADTADLLFDPVAIVRYCSTILTLRPGDVIATGTPAGVGAGRTPPRWLEDGDEVVTRIEGVGVLRNRCRRGLS